MSRKICKEKRRAYHILVCCYKYPSISLYVLLIIVIIIQCIIRYQGRLSLTNSSLSPSRSFSVSSFPIETLQTKIIICDRQSYVYTNKHCMPTLILWGRKKYACTASCFDFSGKRNAWQSSFMNCIKTPTSTAHTTCSLSVDTCCWTIICQSRWALTLSSPNTICIFI